MGLTCLRQNSDFGKTAEKLLSQRITVDDVGTPVARRALLSCHPHHMPADDSQTVPLEEAVVVSSRDGSNLSSGYKAQRSVTKFFVPTRIDPLRAKNPGLAGTVLPPPANVYVDRVLLPRTAPKPVPEPTRAHPADPDDGEAQAKPKLPAEL
jgi:hypothetical protein